MCDDIKPNCYYRNCEKDADYEIIISETDYNELREERRHLYKQGGAFIFTCLCSFHFLIELNYLLGMGKREFTIYPC